MSSPDETRLGALAVQKGYLTFGQLQVLLSASRPRAGKGLQELLVAARFVSREQLLDLLQQVRVGARPSGDAQPDPSPSGRTPAPRRPAPSAGRRAARPARRTHYVPAFACTAALLAATAGILLLRVGDTQARPAADGAQATASAPVHLEAARPAPTVPHESPTASPRANVPGPQVAAADGPRAPVRVALPAAAATPDAEDEIRRTLEEKGREYASNRPAAGTAGPERGAPATSDGQKAEPAAPARSPAAPPAAPRAAPKAPPAAGGWRVVSVAARRRDGFQPGDLTGELRRRKDAELRITTEQARMSHAGTLAARARAEREQRERETGVYDVATVVDNGAASNRVDVTIVTSGFPRAKANHVNAMAEKLARSLLRVEPFQNYPAYVNVHRVNIDDPEVAGKVVGESCHIPFHVAGTRPNAMLTCDRGPALEYAAYAPGADLVVVFCNTADVRATGSPQVISIDADMGMGPVFIHELGHAFSLLEDEYVEVPDHVRPALPELDEEEESFAANVTHVRNPGLAKWHYWRPDSWPTAYVANCNGDTPQVGCYEGAGRLYPKGVFRPEHCCRMRDAGHKMCVVCLEQTEKRIYTLTSPIDDALPHAATVALWRDEPAAFSATALRTVSAAAPIGSYRAFWYVDLLPRPATEEMDRATALTLKAGELPPGVHEVGLRLDFINRRVRRDHGFLSGSRGWTVDVSPYARPAVEGPERVSCRIGEPLAFEIRVANPEPARFRLEARDIPEGATFEDGRFSWSPAKQNQGAWRPRFLLTDGKWTAEKAVEISVVDASESDTEPILLVLDPLTVEEGKPLTLRLEVQDVDGDNLVFSAPKLPAGAWLEPHGGVLHWTPGYSQAGRYAGVGYEVFDGTHRVRGTFDVVVLDRPAPAEGRISSAAQAGGPAAGGAAAAGDEPEAAATAAATATDFDVLDALRSPNYNLRAYGLTLLARHARTLRCLEAARLLRDRRAPVRAAALRTLRGLMAAGGEALAALLVRDIGPHAWDFTDDREALRLLAELVAGGKGDRIELAGLQAQLARIDRYNAERGFAK